MSGSTFRSFLSPFSSSRPFFKQGANIAPNKNEFWLPADDFQDIHRIFQNALGPVSSSSASSYGSFKDFVYKPIVDEIAPAILQIQQQVHKNENPLDYSGGNPGPAISNFMEGEQDLESLSQSQSFFKNQINKVAIREGEFQKKLAEDQVQPRLKAVEKELGIDDKSVGLSQDKHFFLRKNQGQYGNFSQPASLEQEWGDVEPYIEIFLKKIGASQGVHASHSSDNSSYSNSSSFKDFVYKPYSPAPVAALQQPVADQQQIAPDQDLSKECYGPEDALHDYTDQSLYYNQSDSSKSKKSNAPPKDTLQVNAYRQEGQANQQQNQEGHFFKKAYDNAKKYFTPPPQLMSLDKIELTQKQKNQIIQRKNPAQTQLTLEHLQKLQKNQNKITVGNYLYQSNGLYQQFSSSKK